MSRLIEILEGCRSLIEVQFKSVIESLNLRVPDYSNVIKKVLDEANEAQVEHAHYEGVNGPIAEIMDKLAELKAENEKLRSDFSREMYRSDLVSRTRNVSLKLIQALKKLAWGMDEDRSVLDDLCQKTASFMNKLQIEVPNLRRIKDQDLPKSTEPVANLIPRVTALERKLKEAPRLATKNEWEEAKILINKMEEAMQMYDTQHKRLKMYLEGYRSLENKMIKLVREASEINTRLGGNINRWRQWSKLLNELDIDTELLADVKIDGESYQTTMDRFRQIEATPYERSEGLTANENPFVDHATEVWLRLCDLIESHR